MNLDLARRVTRQTLIPAWLPLAMLVVVSTVASAQRMEADYVARNFRFASGETLPELRVHYATLGRPRRGAGGVVDNAVLMLHGTTGSGTGLVSPMSPLFAPGELLDTSRYFVVLPDGIGHGKSSKPSDGLRMKFPKYTYDDMVDAQHRLLTEGLKVAHLRLVMGTSMGCMHAWVWGERYPGFADGLVPLACAPTVIAGRNRMIRRFIIDAIMSDPEWKGGDYQSPPIRGMRAAMGGLWVMTSAPLVQHRQAPTRAQADSAMTAYLDRQSRALDANDVIYAFEASREYDPSARLESIAVPVLAINSADDFVNPPELGLMEKLIPRVKNARYVLIPTSERTRGHGTHSRPDVWHDYLAEFLASLPPPDVSNALTHDSSRMLTRGASRMLTQGASRMLTNDSSRMMKNVLLDPDSPEWSKPAPAVSHLTFETTKGTFVIELIRDWGPLGADRFYNLARLGYYDDTRFHRVDSNYIAQFGLHGDPAVNAAWKSHPLADDAPRSRNARGTFAFAYLGPGHPNTRNTQVYVNLADNARNDAEPFTVLGRVVEGMAVLDSLYAGYGERSGGGMRQGRQGPLEAGGNAYMDREYPLLDRIIRVTVATVRPR
ncbi:MAG TPA: alpha/beta fold hydrolase [Gemmatimonadaceae bacterium]|nr:alpha/beta fold hydrolase [Gemmatimonadaceae bacterium]